MSEVVVVAAITARPGQRDEVERLAREIAIAPTHAEEGCVTYALHHDTRHPDRLVFIERWTSAQALAAHLEMPHLAAFREAITPFSAGPAEIYVLEACVAGDPAKGTLAG